MKDEQRIERRINRIGIFLAEEFNETGRETRLQLEYKNYLEALEWVLGDYQDG